MNYEIKKRDGKVYITVTLNHRGPVKARSPREKVRKQDVENILISENIKHGECIEDPGTLTNFTSGGLVKTWVFESLVKSRSPKKTPIRTTKPRKIKKT